MVLNVIFNMSDHQLQLKGCPDFQMSFIKVSTRYDISWKIQYLVWTLNPQEIVTRSTMPLNWLLSIYQFLYLFSTRERGQFDVPQSADVSHGDKNDDRGA